MIYHITYLSDGLRVKGYLALPAGYELDPIDIQTWIEKYYGCSDLPVTLLARNRKRVDQTRLYPEMKDTWPIMLYCRGGIGKVGSVKTNWLERFAQHGHVVFAPSYRGNEGGEGRDEFGGADQEDVRSAIRLLQQLPFTDEARIAVMGFSRGAINAAQAAAQLPQITRLVLWSGVADLARTYEERVDLRRMLKRVLRGNPAKNAEAYAARSPLQLAEYIRCPVLIIHGTDDVLVDYGHGRDMHAKLQELGRDVIMHTYEGYGHHFHAEIHKVAIANMYDWIRK
ncbi:alpha/beta hydrolase family protein [Paenibacillus marinisediminis]